MPNFDDQVLVEQAQSDPQAFGALYDRYVNRIYGYAYRQTHDEALAQDVTAVTFEKALRHIRKYQWQGKSFVAWLYRIARNEIIQQHRKQKFLAPWRKNGQVTEGRLVEESVQSHERRQQLHAALAQLKTKDREIISLRYFEGLSGEETAVILGCSPANAHVRLHRALKRLRQQLNLLEAKREVNYA